MIITSQVPYTPRPTIPSQGLLAPTHYISPGGSDTTGDGTVLNPWRTIGKFHSAAANPGDVLWCRGGVYQGADIGGHVITKLGSTPAPITVMAAANEVPIFRGGGGTPVSFLMNFIQGSGHWTIDGLRIEDWFVTDTAVFTSTATVQGGTHHFIWKNIFGTMGNNLSDNSHFFYAGGNTRFFEIYGNDVDGVFGTNNNGSGFVIFHTDGADDVNVHHNIFRNWTRQIEVADPNANNVTIEHNTFFSAFTQIQVSDAGTGITVRSNAGVNGSNANVLDLDAPPAIDVQSNNVWGLVVGSTLNSDGTLPAGSPAIGAGHDGQNAGAK